MTEPDSGDSLRREAKRLHRRYCIEVIERFGLCPWAKAARLSGRTRTFVVENPRLSIPEIAAELRPWSADMSVDVIFVVAPTFLGNFHALAGWGEEFADALGDAFFAAAFHPEPSASAGVVHLLRQSPDPTVQLIRRAPLESLRAQEPPHYRDVFALSLHDLEAPSSTTSVAQAVVERNARVFEGEDGGSIERAVAAIRLDRDSTYARLDHGPRADSALFQPPNVRFR